MTERNEDSTVRSTRPFMNISRRITPRPKGSTSKGLSDEFGDDGLDDRDLLSVVDSCTDLEFPHIDDIGDETVAPTEQNTGKYQRKKRPDTTVEGWRPEKLDNGKWACNHKCKDKRACKHLCCREGCDNPPKAPKKSIYSTEKTGGPLNSTQRPQRLQGGQTTLSLATMTKSSNPVTSIVAQIDLTHESKKKKNGASTQIGPEQIDRLHSMTQKSHLEPRIRSLDAHRLLEMERSSDYGDSWPDDTEPPQGCFEKAAKASSVKAKLSSPASLGVFGFSAEDPMDLTVTDQNPDFGEIDSMLDAVMVGLADSQDLQVDRLASANYLGRMNNDCTKQTRLETPEKPERKKLKADFSESTLPPEETFVQSNSFKETSSPFFSAPQYGKISTVLESGQQTSKKRKHSHDSKIIDTPSALAVPPLESCSPNPESLLTELEASSKNEGVDDWLIQEFGQYVDFI
jgi:ATP-dependent DNA helicase HFM1/MER3